MSLEPALESLRGLAGLAAGLVLTHDGLVVEQVGDGFAADVLAAELAGIGSRARQGMSNLALGSVKQLWITVQAYEVAIIMLPGYWLALVFDGHSMLSPLPALERVLQPLQAALGGR